MPLIKIERRTKERGGMIVVETHIAGYAGDSLTCNPASMIVRDAQNFALLNVAFVLYFYISVGILFPVWHQCNLRYVK